MRQDNLTPVVSEALAYLKSGGLGEVIGFTDIALRGGNPKVQSDTDMVMALCLLAADGLELQSSQALLSECERVLEPFARADRAIGDEPGPFRFETGTGHRTIERADLHAATAVLAKLKERSK